MTLNRKIDLPIFFRVFLQFSRTVLTGVYVNFGVYVLVKTRFIILCLQHTYFLFQFIL